MPLLAARLARHFETEGLAERLAQLHPLERLSLGRCYDGLGWVDAGLAAYRSVLDASGDPSMLVQAFGALSALYKRLERREEAAALWEEWIGTAYGDDLTPYIELAKYHEWRTGDLAAARGWAAWALRIVEGWAPGYEREETLADLRHRLARLERKLTGGTTEQVEDD